MATPSIPLAPALSEFQRNQLWTQWIGASTRTLYYSRLAGLFAARQDWTSGISLFLSLSVVGTFLSSPLISGTAWLNSPLPWIKTLLPLAAGALNAAALVKQYTKKSYECSDLYSRWAKLELECRALWGDMYETNAPAKLASIQEKALEISSASVRSIPNKRRLMAKCQDRATQDISTYLGS